MSSFPMSREELISLSEENLRHHAFVFMFQKMAGNTSVFEGIAWEPMTAFSLSKACRDIPSDSTVFPTADCSWNTICSKLSNSEGSKFNFPNELKMAE